MTKSLPNRHQPDVKQPEVLNADDALQRVRSLTDDLLHLHSRGMLHRSMFSDLSDAMKGPLPHPSEDVVTIGGPAYDAERCPPEFRRSREIALPAEIEAAR